MHDDFKRRLCTPTVTADAIDNAAEELFGASKQDVVYEPKNYEVDSAFQDEQTLAMIVQAEKNRNYSLVFMNARMPPGVDGIKTIARIWEKYPTVDAVICTAFADCSWLATVIILGPSAHLLVLKKSLDADAVQQMALTPGQKNKTDRNQHQDMKPVEKCLEECNRNVSDLKRQVGQQQGD